MFRDLLNFTTKYIGGQINAFSFLFVPLVMWKVQRVESINIQSDCKATSNKITDPFSVFKCSGKLQKIGEC